MHLTSFLQNGQLTIALTGEIDHHRAKGLISAITGKIEAYNPNICILDFHDVTFMDSSGLGLILGRYNKTLALGTEFEIANPGEKIMKIITMAGVDKIIKIKGVEK